MSAQRIHYLFVQVLAALIFLPSIVLAKDKPLKSQEVTVDAVVASVDGRPITLREVLGKLPKERAVTLQAGTLQEVSKDPEFRYLLDQLIFESVVNAEAKNRKIDVSDEELNRYIDEVAKRNNLSRDGFEKALRDEGKEIAAYKDQIRTEIIKSKLGSSLFQSGVTVTDEEVKKYLKEQHADVSTGSKLKLRQIFISLAARDRKEALEKINAIKARLEDGDDFSEVAQETSEGAEAAEGGSLGILAEADLNPKIFEAVMGLEEEKVSDVVESDAGLHLFLVEQRFVEEDKQDETLEAEVRKQLEREKKAAKAQEYFTTELYKNHSIDKKI